MVAKVPGKRQDVALAYRFLVEIEGFEYAGFSKVTGMTSETEATDYREGGDNSTFRKIPGMTSFENIVLTRGVGPAKDFVNWRKEVFSPDTGEEKQDIYKDVFITVQTPRSRETVRKFQVLNAWPMKIEHGDLDANSSDVFIESLELAHEGWKEISS